MKKLITVCLATFLLSAGAQAQTTQPLKKTTQPPVAKHKAVAKLDPASVQSKAHRSRVQLQKKKQ
jgi:uncharacterized lipoprotein YajG